MWRRSAEVAKPTSTIGSRHGLWIAYSLEVTCQKEAVQSLRLRVRLDNFGTVIKYEKVVAEDCGLRVTRRPARGPHRRFSVSRPPNERGIRDGARWWVELRGRDDQPDGQPERASPHRVRHAVRFEQFVCYGEPG